jgi:flagellar basal-body rod protein FlgB
MESSGPGLFDLAQRRLQWLGARQGVLSENVANADTPGWVARDVKPFAAVLGSQLSAPIGAVPAGQLEQTGPMHLAGLVSSDQGTALLRGEKAPDGNQVSVDQQMEKIAQTDSQHEAVTAIYMKYLGMFRMALGK